MLVLLTGVLLAALVKVPTVIGAGAILFIMFFHGYAYGSEIPLGVSMQASS